MAQQISTKVAKVASWLVSHIWVGIGLVITIPYFIWLHRYVSTVDLSGLKPNDLGSFLGGAFGPIAFIWLVIGYFQQGQELRFSSRALELQSEELRNSVEQQRALVEVTKEQYQHERAARIEAEAQAERMAQPILGFQSGGANFTGSGASFTFIMANTGASCSSVKLHDQSQNHGEAAIWNSGDTLCVVFQFGPSEPITDRNLSILFKDARGQPKSQEVVFRAYDAGNGSLVLQTPA